MIAIDLTGSGTDDYSVEAHSAGGTPCVLQNERLRWQRFSAWHLRFAITRCNNTIHHQLIKHTLLSSQAQNASRWPPRAGSKIAFHHTLEDLVAV